MDKLSFFVNRADGNAIYDEKKWVEFNTIYYCNGTLFAEGEHVFLSAVLSFASVQSFNVLLCIPAKCYSLHLVIVFKLTFEVQNAEQLITGHSQVSQSAIWWPQLLFERRPRKVLLLPLQVRRIQRRGMPSFTCSPQVMNKWQSSRDGAVATGHFRQSLHTCTNKESLKLCLPSGRSRRPLLRWRTRGQASLAQGTGLVALRCI